MRATVERKSLKVKTNTMMTECYRCSDRIDANAMKRYAFAVLLFLMCLIAQAQTDSIPLGRTVVRATQYGIGYTNTLDTYLSPAEYTGMQARVLRESVRPVSLWNIPVDRQCLFQVYGALLDNRAGNGQELSGHANWNLAFLKPWLQRQSFSLAAGPMAEANLGMTYNVRNSNNPVQVQAYGSIGMAGMATYAGHWGGRKFTARYFVHVPLAGVMFSPEYGESYYEMSLSHDWGKNVGFASLHNRPSVRQFLSIDVPMHRYTLRATYECDLQQARMHHLKNHQWSHVLMLGFVKCFQILPYQP